MAATKTNVDYCNRALALLGESEINELTADESATSGTCTQLYEPAVEWLLSQHNWSFATRYVTLTREDVTPPDPWGNQYRLPTDSLRVWGTDEPGEDWLVRAHPTSDWQILLINRTGVKLTYIYRANEATFSAVFQSALVAQLAAVLAVPVAGVDRGTQLASFYRGEAAQALGSAMVIDASQSPAANMADNGDLLDARRGGTGWLSGY
jgi:hypothetical protein